MNKQWIAQIFAISITGGLANAANDFIEQIQLIKNDSGQVVQGIVQHIYVSGPDEVGEKSGKTPAVIPIGEYGSILVLNGVGIGDDKKLYILDQTMVSAFLPKAQINIQSLDPYEVTRTRADEPVIVSIDVDGLLQSLEAPEAAKQVYVERVVQSYSSDVNRIPVSGNINETVVEAFYYNQNGKIEGLMNTLLDTEYDFGQRGEETYRVYALPDSDLGWSVIDEQKVQVWPIAQAELSGLKHEDSLRGALPNLTLKFEDLYPTSLTYLQLYEGEQKLNTQGEVIEGSKLVFNTITPQTPGEIVIPSSELEKHITKNGIYTLELVTATPFNDGKPEVLTYATFEIDWTIKIRGTSIYTAE